VRLNVRAQAVWIDKGGVLALVKGTEGVSLVRIKPSFEMEEVYKFGGSRGFVLAKAGDVWLASVDNVLYSSRDLAEWRPALRLAEGNFIWHVSETPEGVLAQEYGEGPTRIYIGDGYKWSPLFSNVDVDPRSRHFHYVAWDPHRGIAYATLGDGNLVRAISFAGRRWRAIYRGPWQFVPVVALEDRVVFGFDSGIARGGVGIYYPERGTWEFLFLRWRGVKSVQMNDLKAFRGVWISAFGAPQAVAVSQDLERWGLLHLEGLSPEFNHVTGLAVGDGFVAASTGKSLLIFGEDDIKSALSQTPVVERYGAWLDRLRGLLFVAKRAVGRA